MLDMLHASCASRIESTEEGPEEEGTLSSRQIYSDEFHQYKSSAFATFAALGDFVGQGDIYYAWAIAISLG